MRTRTRGLRCGVKPGGQGANPGLPISGYILMGVAVLRLRATRYTDEPRTLQLRPEKPISVLDHAHFETPVWTRGRSAAAWDAGGIGHHGDLVPRTALPVACGAAGAAGRRANGARAVGPCCGDSGRWRPAPLAQVAGASRQPGTPGSAGPARQISKSYFL